MKLFAVILVQWYAFSVDVSKQRQRLRTKISAEKTKLEQVIAKYNRLSIADSVQLHEIESGTFPWKADTDTPFGTGVPIRTKRLVVEKQMEASRFQEEIELLEKEMLRFMKFYKNSLLPYLFKEQEKLQEVLKGSLIARLTGLLPL